MSIPGSPASYIGDRSTKQLVAGQELDGHSQNFSAAVLALVLTNAPGSRSIPGTSPWAGHGIPVAMPTYWDLFSVDESIGDLALIRKAEASQLAGITSPDHLL